MPLSSVRMFQHHYYAMLRSTLMQVPRRNKLIVLGDFNARIGSDTKIWGNVMGKHGVGNINSNGQRLLSLCSEFGLFVTNTLFQLKHKHKTTWMHPRSRHWHLLDQCFSTFFASRTTLCNKKILGNTKQNFIITIMMFSSVLALLIY